MFMSIYTILIINNVKSNSHSQRFKVKMCSVYINAVYVTWRYSELTSAPTAHAMKRTKTKNKVNYLRISLSVTCNTRNAMCLSLGIGVSYIYTRARFFILFAHFFSTCPLSTMCSLSIIHKYILMFHHLFLELLFF